MIEMHVCASLHVSGRRGVVSAKVRGLLTSLRRLKASVKATSNMPMP